MVTLHMIIVKAGTGAGEPSASSKQRGLTPLNYWEGAVDVTGTERGQAVRGRGYIELTGYAERFKQKL